MTRLDFLEKNLDRQLNLLKFAEAKNALLLSVSIGLIGLIIKNVSDYSESVPIKLYCYMALAFYFFAALICLNSFFPKVKANSIPDNQATSYNRSLTYFGDLQTFSVETFQLELKKSSSWKKQFSELEKEYASQIIINAKIAARKMKLFKFAMYLFTCGFATIPIGIVIFLYNEKSDFTFTKLAKF